MTINLKQIKLYQEFDPYDVDVDNRPILDIQDNIFEIVSLLQDAGFYSEIAADPSQEPAGGFTPFTCACVYSNSLLVPIDISKPTYEIDYTTYPIVLVLAVKDPSTNLYPCLYFSAGITLVSKLATFVPGSQGRILRVGPAGALVDQMYYDLAYASSNYQALYVGKILGPNSLSFGGNQVSILGNNFYLAKNRDDNTSGLVTVERNNADSNIVFKAINVNSINAQYTYAEFVNSYTSPGAITRYSSVPIYFSSGSLSFDQSTGVFLALDLESSLNEIHFTTPPISTFIGATQTYLTAGVNVNALLSFASTNVLHAPSYSDTIFETIQGINTRLSFIDRAKILSTDPDIPIGIQYNSPVKSIGDSIFIESNLPNTILPTVDSTGVIVGDYFNTAGGYIGGVQDNYDLTLSSTTPAVSSRKSASVETANQKSAGFTSNGYINSITKTFTTNLTDSYSNSFTLLVSAKSSTTVPSNIAISADGYINLSSGAGTLVNRYPVLDTEVVPKLYVDNLVYIAMLDADSKIPLRGTVQASGATIAQPVYGLVSWDMTQADSSVSTSQVLSFTSINTTDILSNNIINFYSLDGRSYNNLYAGSLAFPDTHMTASYELVNKGFLEQYVSTSLADTAYVQVNPAFPQVLNGGTNAYGLTITDSLLSLQTSSGDATTQPDPVLQLLASESGKPPVIITVDWDNNLIIDNSVGQILLTRDTLSADDDLSVPTKYYVDNALSASAGQKSCGQYYNYGSTTLSLSGIGGLEDYFTPASTSLTCKKACMCMVTFSFNGHTASGKDRSIDATLSIGKGGTTLSASETSSWASSASNNSNREELSTSISAVAMMAVGEVLNFSLIVAGSSLEVSHTAISVMVFGA